MLKKGEENEYLSTTPGIYEDQIFTVQKENNNMSDDKKSTPVTENIASTTTNPDANDEHV